MTDHDRPRTIQSLEKGSNIIDELRETNGARLTEIADALGLSAGSVHTYLATLREIGYVVKDGDQYRLGAEFVTLGEYVRNNSPLYRAARVEVDKLAEKTEEAVHLIVEQDGRGIALYERFGEEAIGTEYHRDLRQHPHQHLHCTASGKAILARLSDERVDDIFDDHGLRAITPNTITNRGDLFDELETIREQGYAVNDEEELLGIAAVGAPVCDQEGTVLGAISVSAPKMRMEREDFRTEIVDLIKRAANVSEVNLQTSNL